MSETFAVIEDAARNTLYLMEDHHNAIQMVPTHVVLNGDFVALMRNIVNVTNVLIIEKEAFQLLKVCSITFQPDTMDMFYYYI